MSFDDAVQAQQDVWSSQMSMSTCKEQLAQVTPQHSVILYFHPANPGMRHPKSSTCSGSHILRAFQDTDVRRCRACWFMVAEQTEAVYLLHELLSFLQTAGVVEPSGQSSDDWHQSIILHPIWQ